MSDKPLKFWNNPTIILGLVVALIVVAAAVLYFFYTRLATCKVKIDDISKKTNQLQSDLSLARNKAEQAEKMSNKVSDLESKVSTLESKVKKLKNTPTKKVKCDDTSCEIQDL